MEKVNSEICFVGPIMQPALLITYFDKDTGGMVFVVRAGANGEGDELAREESLQNERSQFEAIKKIREKLDGLSFENQIQE